MRARLVLLVAALVHGAVAKQPSAPDAQPAHLRPLKFGDLNFLHTTDTHGWHAGHLLEPSFSADWGDYIDFTTHLRNKLEADGKDLLVIDTGDRVEGNGLYDADVPKGNHTFPIFERQHIDIICSGNHELYQKSTSDNEYLRVVPAYEDSYIASNIDVYDEYQKKWIPLAPRYKKFTTPVQGIRIMSFGFLFNFTSNNKIASNVTKVGDVVLLPWFKNAIKDPDVDLFVVIGHAGVRSDEFGYVFQAIRAARPDIPVQFFGGHVHIRDYKKFDDRSYGLASGRFMETIGFQSIDGLSSSYKTQKVGGPTFSRSYIDSNLYSFYKHSGHGAKTFHTEYGRQTSEMITFARQQLNLDTKFGCAPQTYWMNRAQYPSNSSIFSWLDEMVFPEKVVNSSRKDKSRLIMVNTGAVRFDIFKGAFTKDTTYIISPFVSGFNYTRDVPYDKAIQVLAKLNKLKTIFSTTSKGVELYPHMLAPPEQHAQSDRPKCEPPELEPYVKHRSVEAENNQGVQLDMTRDRFQQVLVDETYKQHRPTPGYTTCDDAGNTGDDTLHSPIERYFVPNVIQSVVNVDARSPPEVVDLIYNEFMTKYVLWALQDLGLKYNASDVERYLYDTSMTDLIAQWVGEHWGQQC